MKFVCSILMLALAAGISLAGKRDIEIAMAMAGVEKPPPPPPKEIPKSGNLFDKIPASAFREEQSSNYSSPPGYHRHVTADGRVIEHSNQNNYRGELTDRAHENLVQNQDGTWSQYTGPRAPDVRLGIGETYRPSFQVNQRAWCPTSN